MAFGLPRQEGPFLAVCLLRMRILLRWDRSLVFANLAVSAPSPYWFLVLLFYTGADYLGGVNYRFGRVNPLLLTPPLD